jgi:hypothetical protein
LGADVALSGSAHIEACILPGNGDAMPDAVVALPDRSVFDVTTPCPFRWRATVDREFFIGLREGKRNVMVRVMAEDPGLGDGT